MKSFPGATTEDMEDFIKLGQNLKNPKQQLKAYTLFMAFSISTSTLCWYIVRFTTTPMQTKTSSPRDEYSITAESIVYLTLQIEDSPNTSLSISGLITR